MSAPNQVSYVTVAQSASLSSAFNVLRAHQVGVWLPTLDSATVAVLVSPDEATAANFVELSDVRSNIAYSFPATTGSLAITVLGLAPWTYGKISLGAVQADVRTIAIIGTIW